MGIGGFTLSRILSLELHNPAKISYIMCCNFDGILVSLGCSCELGDNSVKRDTDENFPGQNVKLW